MKIIEILELINSVADNKGLSTPYIVGGLARDKLMNNISEIHDIDITTGDEGIHHLAREFANKLDSKKSEYILNQDGHARVMVGDLKIDFSSNFKNPGIVRMLREMGINNPSEMEKELYSRDFNCNTLLLDLDLQSIHDETKKAIPDIKNKVISTCLDEDITLRYNKNRWVRAIYLSSKLGFSIDPKIISWVQNNERAIEVTSQQYVVKKIKKALEYNFQNTVDVITEMNIWKNIPYIQGLEKYLTGVK